ncbi:hypothetical protein TEA_011199 [Camellia sinensis var. sinensis]|uniref:Methionyl/Valyl/Leucyl/Isoleucyl-tRNA synthetase anticodon-binding domain-containing protein n=1 Tax=Camellia sinensis var. sinensis TaxID=542762 RepID=A0A4S4D632_CAMSN|nr:hypothetical protein TEA_011199 [Camellia sinensis var. sinensis]
MFPMLLRTLSTATYPLLLLNTENYSSVDSCNIHFVRPRCTRHFSLSLRCCVQEAPSYGADVLSLWVSSVDYTCDVLIGPQGDNVVPYSDLPMIDQHALFQLENVVQNIKDSFKNYQFFKIFQIIQRFAIVDLSDFYFDAAKDRLYVGYVTLHHKELYL